MSNGREECESPERPSADQFAEFRKTALLLLLFFAGVGVLAFLVVNSGSSLSAAEAGNLLDSALAVLESGRAEEVQEAITRFQGGRFQEHLQVLDAALFLHGHRPQQCLDLLSRVSSHQFRRHVLFYTARAWIEQNKLIDAERALLHVVNEFPDDVDSFRWLGVLYYDLGAYDPAIVSLSHVVRLAPDDYRPHRLLAIMQFDFERHSEAIGHFKDVMDRLPPDEIREEAVCGRAMCRIALREYEEALQLLEGNSVSSTEAEVLRAECHLHLLNLEKAESLLTDVIRHSPTDRRALLVYSRVLTETSRPREAVEVLQQVRELHPYDAECRYLLAGALAELGMEDQAGESLSEWKQLKEKSRRLFELSKHVLDKPHDRELREELATVCDALGKSELAERWRRAARAVAQEPPVLAKETD